MADTVQRAQNVLEHADRVRAVVEAEQRTADNRAAFPQAANPREASRHHAAKRRAQLKRMAATLPADLDGGEAA